jgi:hypothetical protein
VREVDWKCRAQFFAISARMMRNILVDHARIRKAAKRGSGNVLPLSDCDLEAGAGGNPDILLVDMALSRFAAKYPRQAQVVDFEGSCLRRMPRTGYGTPMREYRRDQNPALEFIASRTRSAPIYFPGQTSRSRNQAPCPLPLFEGPSHGWRSHSVENRQARLGRQLEIPSACSRDRNHVGLRPPGHLTGILDDLRDRGIRFQALTESIPLSWIHPYGNAGGSAYDCDCG